MKTHNTFKQDNSSHCNLQNVLPLGACTRFFSDTPPMWYKCKTQRSTIERQKDLTALGKTKPQGHMTIDCPQGEQLVPRKKCTLQTQSCSGEVLQVGFYSISTQNKPAFLTFVVKMSRLKLVQEPQAAGRLFQLCILHERPDKGGIEVNGGYF